MTTFDNITKAKAMWNLIIGVHLPPDSTIYRWLLNFSLEEYEKAVSKILWRFRGKDLSTLDPVQVHKFVTSSLIAHKGRKGEL
jgi:hypothetical protein